MNIDYLVMLYMAVIKEPIFWVLVVIASVVQGALVWLIKR